MLGVAREHSLKIQQHLLRYAQALEQSKAILSTSCCVLVHMG